MINSPKFTYSIHIKVSPERIWAAIKNPSLTRQFWGKENISDWKEGSIWRHIDDDNRRTVRVVGKILKIGPKELILTWADPDNIKDNSCVTFKIETAKEAMSLKVIHDNFKVGSKMPDMIKDGWPQVLSNMKSFLENDRDIIAWDN